MIKKIGVRQLKPGMFVHDMNCGWMAHPFLRGSFKVRGDSEIEKMVSHGILELYIDSEKGLDVSDAPTQPEVEASLSHQMAVIVDKFSPLEPTSLREELGRARTVVVEANRIVCDLMNDARVGRQIEQERMDHVVGKMADSILRNKYALLSLCRIKKKDEFTFSHSISVGAMLMSFSRAFNLKPDDMQLVGIGGMLHDVGKTMVPDRILNKAGSLTNDEFATMKMHVHFGQSIVSDMPGISQTSLDVVAQHHERYDGSGYPLKLKGDAMSIYGQMASIVDVYDSITSDRCYGSAMEPAVALRKMFEWSKSYFAPELIQFFVRTVGIYPVGTLVMLESGKLAVVIEQQGRDLTRPLVRAVFDSRKNGPLAVHDIDLSKPLGQGGGDRIANHEAAAKWNIDPQRFI